MKNLFVVDSQTKKSTASRNKRKTYSKNNLQEEFTERYIATYENPENDLSKVPTQIALRTLHNIIL